MPRLSTSELRNLADDDAGDSTDQRRLFDAGFRASKRRRSDSVSIKQEDNDDSTNFLALMAEAKKKHRRPGYRANSIKSTTVFRFPHPDSGSSSHSHSSTQHHYHHDDTEPSSKKRKASTKPTTLCCGCLDPFKFHQLIPLPCDTCLNPDKYCKPCLNAWYTITLATKTFPTCCNKELISSDLFDLLPLATRRKYSDVLEERSNESINVRSLFCAACDGYIRSSQIAHGFGSCPSCHNKTCLKCHRKRSEHAGIHVLCPTFLEDPIFQGLDTGRFRRCPKCAVMIEKVSGCQELRCSQCRCVFQFCCGERKCVCGKLAEEDMEDDLDMDADMERDLDAFMEFCARHEI